MCERFAVIGGGPMVDDDLCAFAVFFLILICSCIRVESGTVVVAMSLWWVRTKAQASVLKISGANMAKS